MNSARAPERGESSIAQSRHGLRVLAQPAFRNRVENPYTTLLYTHLLTRGVHADEFSWRRALLGRYDIWHLHWPESYPNKRAGGRAIRQSVGLLALLWWARARGTRVVWTVHNLAAHEQIHPRLHRWFLTVFLRLIDGFVSLSATGDELARRRMPQLRRVAGFVIPHGHYRECYTNRLSRSEARER
jgi:beta-1,4-mannosyltransferase